MSTVLLNSANAVATAGHIPLSPIEEKIINMTVDDGSDAIMDGATRAIRFAIAVSKLEDIFGGARPTGHTPPLYPHSPGMLDPSIVQSDPIMPHSSTYNDEGIVYGQPPTGDHEVWELPDGNGYYDDGPDSTWEETLGRSWSFSIEYVAPTEFLGSFTTSSESSGWRCEVGPSSTRSRTRTISPETGRSRVDGLRADWLQWRRRRGGRCAPRREEERGVRDRRNDEDESVGCRRSWKTRESGRERGEGATMRRGRMSRLVRRWIGECWKL